MGSLRLCYLMYPVLQLRLWLCYTLHSLAEVRLELFNAHGQQPWHHILSCCCRLRNLDIFLHWSASQALWASYHCWHIHDFLESGFSDLESANGPQVLFIYRPWSMSRCRRYSYYVDGRCFSWRFWSPRNCICNYERIGWDYCVDNSLDRLASI